MGCGAMDGVWKRWMRTMGYDNAKGGGGRKASREDMLVIYGVNSR